MRAAFQLILLGALFHLLYIFSIFDIYFTSPLVHGMTPFKLEGEAYEPPAKRLFLIVGDGLRADTLFDNTGSELAPHLHHHIRTKASYGVSHTRVPTESRPGHVAVIAGFYEDVSAVTKGWKLNPITFDSLFNQSRMTYSFGSPDILPMFQLGASDHSRVNTSMYSAEDENFAKDPRWLDDWVFERVDAMLDSADSDPALHKTLHSDGVVIFLHCLGLDTAGHATWPGKPEYRGVLANLDHRLKSLEERIEKFYPDGRTSFILTADHGMGNQGSHGDGHPDNTRTPLVAWGAGIAGPDPTPMKGHDSFTENWKINQYARKDVNQADLAPLMASLLGIHYPMNSVGILPLSYLNASESFKASSAMVNAQQVVAQYHVKNDIKKQTELFFKPFKPSTASHFDPDQQLTHIQALIAKGDYYDAERLSVELINVTLQGLRYLQTYDWLFLRSIVSAGYIGWILYCVVFIFHTFQKEVYEVNTSWWVPLLTYGTGAFFTTVLVLQHAPWKYYLYLAFPIYFWNRVLTQGNVLVTIFARSWHQGAKLRILAAFVITLASIELLVASYFHREILTLGLVLASLWPWIEAPTFLRQKELKLFLQWSAICFVAAVFPLLPVEKEENLRIIALGGLLVALIGVITMYYAPHLTVSKLQGLPEEDQVSRSEVIRIQLSSAIQVFMVLVSIGQMWVSGSHLQARQEVPGLCYLVGWSVIIGSIGYLFYITHSTDHYIRRLLAIFLGFAPTYVILSISYEVLFYVTYFVILLTWLQLERALYEAVSLPGLVKKDGTLLFRPLGLIDLRSAILFLFYLNLAFFGTGNIASISSFSLQAVFRLTIEFDAFAMGSLLVVKILTPFFLLVSHFTFAGTIVDLQPLTPFLLVMAATDIMTLNFFFLVRDEGSWLEIGTSISHFAIGSLFSLFISLLYLVAHWLTRSSLHRPIKPRRD